MAWALKWAEAGVLHSFYAAEGAFYYRKAKGCGNDDGTFEWKNIIMADLIFIGVIVAFFVLAGLYAGFCEKL